MRGTSGSGDLRSLQSAAAQLSVRIAEPQGHFAPAAGDGEDQFERAAGGVGVENPHSERPALQQTDGG